MRMGILHCRRVGGVYDHRMEFGSLVWQELSGEDGAKVEAELFIPVLLFLFPSLPFSRRAEILRAVPHANNLQQPAAQARSIPAPSIDGLEHFAYCNSAVP